MAIERTQIIRIARSWIGTPYIHQASVKGVGCDCLGLLRGVWRELHGDEPESAPPYSPDWAEATGEETLYMALSRHLREIDKRDMAPGDIALLRMLPRGPAKHCGILASNPHGQTLIHARQNTQVSEETFSIVWRRKFVAAFRI
jgi:NlpC/P60 family putative phage cell wall peptidase